MGTPPAVPARPVRHIIGPAIGAGVLVGVEGVLAVGVLWSRSRVRGPGGPKVARVAEVPIQNTALYTLLRRR